MMPMERSWYRSPTPPEPALDLIDGAMTKTMFPDPIVSRSISTLQKPDSERRSRLFDGTKAVDTFRETRNRVPVFLRCKGQDESAVPCRHASDLAKCRSASFQK
jgi:hypothetical protein